MVSTSEVRPSSRHSTAPQGRVRRTNPRGRARRHRARIPRAAELGGRRDAPPRGARVDQVGDVDVEAARRPRAGRRGGRQRLVQVRPPFLIPFDFPF